MNTMDPLLTDLFSRAGASDTDRDLWLQERLGGVTATEMRDLMLRGEPFSVELEKRKRGLASDSFHGNKYTDHGKKREPVIAAKVQRDYGIAPESRVFHSAINSRYLASPDGVGVVGGELVLSEIKTSGKRKFPGTDAFEQSGYRDQIQWALFVTGAVRCLYVLEQCFWGAGNELVVPELFDWDDPDLQVAWVTRDEARISELKATADEFLERLDGDYAPPIIPEGVEQMARDYRAGLDQEKVGKTLAMGALDRAKDALAGVGAAKWDIPGYSVSWTPGKESAVEVPDEEAAKAADPKLYASLQRARKALAKKEAAWVELCGEHKKTEVKQGRPSLRVTPVKSKGEGK